MDERDITDKIIGETIDVHRALGPGLLESAYEACLAHELGLRALPFERQKPINIQYKGVEVECGFRVDLWVANQVIVELKTVEALAPIHKAQLLTYLKLTGCRLGLLINFNVYQLVTSIKRVIPDEFLCVLCGSIF